MRSLKHRPSFRSVLSISMLICWLLPIIIISTTASMLLNRNYNRNLRRATNAEFNSAMWQVEVQVSAAIEDSKAVSYNGIVYQAYQNQLHSPGEFDALGTISDYLNVKFSRNLMYRAVFISFLDDSLGILPCAAVPGLSKVELLRSFQSTVLPQVHELVKSADSDNFFTVIGDDLYLVRQLTDDDLVPYAILVMQLEKAELVQSLYHLAKNEQLEFFIDGIAIPLGIEPEVTMDPSRIADISYSSEVGGHTLLCNGQVIGLNIWTTIPVLRWIIFTVVILVGPMLVIIILLFYRNINRPINILMDAYSRIQEGQRGFTIQKKAPNSEFELLYDDFNAMSCQLECQFKQLYDEQQALQQAKIKALQSQINPHFLNNTLEVINWEARLSDNERVCSMIEALSTMLDAAIGRDGRSQVLLSEELKYVEAYLHITKERLGDRLTITRRIEPETLSCTVPLLTLQPLLENAVEYDLSRGSGELSLRTFLWDGKLHLEVEHDGSINADGWRKIKAGLQADAAHIDGRSIGIRNIANRLALIYGDRFYFDIREEYPGRVLAEIIIPTTV